MVATYKMKAFELLELNVKAMQENGTKSITTAELSEMIRSATNQAFESNRRFSGEEVANVLTDFVNGGNKEQMDQFVHKLTKASHRTLQENVFDLFLEAVKSWGKMHDDDMYDGRNKNTVKTSNQIVKFLEL